MAVDGVDVVPLTDVDDVAANGGRAGGVGANDEFAVEVEEFKELFKRLSNISDDVVANAVAFVNGRWATFEELLLGIDLMVVVAASIIEEFEVVSF